MKTLLKLSIVLFTSSIFLESCQTKKNDKLILNRSNFSIDTLKLNENIFEQKNLSRRLIRQNKIVHFFKVGDTTILYCDYKNLYKKVLKNSDIYYRSADKSIIINRINNNIFFVYVPKSYQKDKVILQSFIQPHSNIILKPYYENQLVDSTSFSMLSVIAYDVKIE